MTMATIGLRDALNQLMPCKKTWENGGLHPLHRMTLPQCTKMQEWQLLCKAADALFGWLSVQMRQDDSKEQMDVFWDALKLIWDWILTIRFQRRAHTVKVDWAKLSTTAHAGKHRNLSVRHKDFWAIHPWTQCLKNSCSQVAQLIWMHERWLFCFLKQRCIQRCTEKRALGSASESHQKHTKFRTRSLSAFCPAHQHCWQWKQTGTSTRFCLAPHTRWATQTSILEAPKGSLMTF